MITLKCTAKGCNNTPSECESNWASLCEYHAIELNKNLASYEEDAIEWLKKLDYENYRRRKIVYYSRWN